MEKRTDMARFVTFQLADNLLGINISDIREIVPGPVISPVPKAPELVSGLMNLRGRILTVLDIRILLRLESGSEADQPLDSHILIFKYHDVGFIAEQIGDVIDVRPGQIAPVPANIHPGIKPFMDHVIQLESELILVVNTRKILDYTPVDKENQ